MFYFLKKISPFLSPLYLIGVLTPVLIVLILITVRSEKHNRTTLDLLFFIWAEMLVLSCCLMLTLKADLDTLGLVIKFITPVLLFFFLRRIIRSKNDLHGLLTTFLYSTVIPFGMMLYEQVFEPLRGTVFTRGYHRYEGLFADVVSYSIYVTGALLISCYFFLSDDGEEIFLTKLIRFWVVAGLTIYALINMHHMASWFVILTLLVLFMAFNVRQGKKGLALLLVFCGVCYLGFGNEIRDRLNRGLDKDIAVIQGVVNSNFALHGRMGRWRSIAEDWKDRPALDKMIGIGVSAESVEAPMFTSGSHSDLIRVLALTGVIGLFVYLLIYGVTLVKTRKLPPPEKFLVYASVIIIMMMSITMTPTLYTPLLYFILPVLAYTALIDEKKEEKVVT